jgi:hypothetical protein
MQEKTLEEEFTEKFGEFYTESVTHRRFNSSDVLSFISSREEKAREEGRKEYKEELLGKLPEEKEDMFTESNINKCFSELINIEKKPLNELLPDLFPDK